MSGFDQILPELCGARLAVYDALIRFGDMDAYGVQNRMPGYAVAQIETAMAWLEMTYLSREIADGVWRARSVADAERRYIASGGMKQTRTIVTTKPPEVKTFTPANEAPEGRCVHNYQVQMFAEV